MSRRSRFPVVGADTYRLLPTEDDALAFWLGDRRRIGFAQLHGGIGWHVRDARGQNVVGMPDVLMVLPHGFRPTVSVLAGLEIKIGSDPVSDEQGRALDLLYAVPWAVAGIVRYPTPRPGEWTQDEAAAEIERTLAS